MDSPLEWTVSVGIPLCAVAFLKEFINPRVIHYVFANKEMISGMAVQGKAAYDVVSQHGPGFWKKVKRHFIEMKGGKAYILCTSNNPLEPDFVGVFSTVSALPEESETDSGNNHRYAENKELIKRIYVGKSAAGMAMSPDKNRIYVVSRVERALYVIDAKKNQVIEIIGDLRENPEEVAITPDGKKACILHRNSDSTQNSQMTILHLQKQRTYPNWKQRLSIDPWKEKLTKKYWKDLLEKGHKQEYVEVGKDPRAIAVTAIKRNGRICHIAFIANYGGQNITCVDVDYPATPIDATVSDSPTHTIPVGDHPHHLVFSQKHKCMYVLSTGSIKRLSLFSWGTEPRSVLEGEIKRPERAVFDQDGRLYITDSGDDSVKIIDETGKLLTRIQVGSHPQGIAIASKIRSCVGNNNRYIWIACANAGSKDGHWIHLFLMEGENYTETTPMLGGAPQENISLKILPNTNKGYWKELTVKILDNHLENDPANAVTNPPNPAAQTEIVSDGERVFVTEPNQEVIYSDPSRIGKARQTLITLSGDSFLRNVRAVPGRAVILPFDANETERRCNFLSVFMGLLYLIVAIQLCIKIPEEISHLVSMKMQPALESGTIIIPILFMLMFLLFIVAIPKMKGKVKLSFVIIAVTLFVAIMILWPLAWAFAVKPPVGYTAYVSDFRGNAVWSMDTETNRTIARIGVGAGPDSLAVFPGATEICVANWRNGTVSIVDTRSNRVTATIPVGNGPRNATMSPDGGECWVSNQFDQSVSVVDMATKQVVATIVVEEEPGAMAFTGDGTKVCVVNVGSGKVSIIDTKIYNATKSIDVGQLPEGIVTNILSNIQWTYVTSILNNSIAVINVKDNERRTIIPIGGDPRGVALVPEKKKLYASIFNAGIVSVINTADDTIITNITVEKRPHTLLLSPDRNHDRLYVANELSSSISVIDTDTDKVIATISIGLFDDELWSIAITSDGNQIVVTYYDSGWISIVDTAPPYAVRTIRIGVNLRQVVFVEK
jgi:YVTN family beta-propeller protein